MQLLQASYLANPATFANTFVHPQTGCVQTFNIQLPPARSRDRQKNALCARYRGSHTICTFLESLDSFLHLAKAQLQLVYSNTGSAPIGDCDNANNSPCVFAHVSATCFIFGRDT